MDVCLSDRSFVRFSGGVYSPSASNRRGRAALTSFGDADVAVSCAGIVGGIVDGATWQVQVVLIFKRLVFLGWNFDVQCQHHVESTI